LKGLNVYEEDVALRDALRRLVPAEEFAIIDSDLKKFGWRVTGKLTPQVDRLVTNDLLR
jgi:hypothetical protein